jgi:hypothetical protein
MEGAIHVTALPESSTATQSKVGCRKQNELVGYDKRKGPMPDEIVCGKDHVSPFHKSALSE